MLINASLTRPCVQKLQALAHGRVSSKLKAAALSPFAGIALPLGDACIHSALAIVKTPFLVAPLSVGRLAGKGFITSLDRRSPRQALLSQMAFHVVRSLASLTLLAVSTLAIPTIPFLVVMPRIVTKTYDRLGLGRLFRTQIASQPKPVAKPAARHVAIINAAPAPLQILQVAPLNTAPFNATPSFVPVVQTPAAISPPVNPPVVFLQQPLKTEIFFAETKEVVASFQQPPVLKAPPQDQKKQKRVGLPPEGKSPVPSKSRLHQEADSINQLFKKPGSRKTNDPAPISQLEKPTPVSAVAVASQPITAPITSQATAAITTQATAIVTTQANASSLDQAHPNDNPSAPPSETDPQNEANKLNQEANKLNRLFKPKSAKAAAKGSVEVTPAATPPSEQPKNSEDVTSATQHEANKLNSVFQAARKPKPPSKQGAETPSKPTIAAILAVPAPESVPETEKEAEKLNHLFKFNKRKSKPPTDENAKPLQS